MTFAVAVAKPQPCWLRATRRMGWAAWCAAALAGCTAAPTAPCALGLATELPIHIAGGHLYTIVKLNGIDLRIIIDTGAEVTAVSRTSSYRIGLANRQAGEFQGIEGWTTAYAFNAATFEIGRLCGTSLSLTAGGAAFSVGDGLTDTMSRLRRLKRQVKGWGRRAVPPRPPVIHLEQGLDGG